MTKGKTKDGLEYLWTDKKRTLFGLPRPLPDII